MNQLMTVDAETGELLKFDPDARDIGELYGKAKSSIVDSVRYQVECGARLSAKKASIPHGQWLPWLEEQKDALGFSDRKTAYRLIKTAEAYGAPAPHLDPAEALKISRQTWGNEHNHRAQGTGENEWYTPAKYIEAARKVLGTIELDPASSSVAQATVKAGRFFTREDNGLTQDWFGKVWLNPPYSQPEIWEFCKKLVDECVAGNVTEAILLTHNYTDTSWFHYAESIATAICFTRGRIAFEDQNGDTCAPTQGQAFFYFGDNGDRFSEVFREFGFVR